LRHSHTPILYDAFDRLHAETSKRILRHGPANVKVGSAESSPVFHRDMEEDALKSRHFE